MGVSCTVRQVITAMSAVMPAGMKNFHCHGSAATNAAPSSRNTRKRPLWIMLPKMALNTPRSLTWNQPLFTLMSASAL